MSIRTKPIKNLIDPSTANRIVNQIIYEEVVRYNLEYKKYLSGKRKKPLSWASNASNRLKDYNIELSHTTLNSYKKAISNGKRDATSAASFGGKTISSRYGKDRMYGQFDMLINLNLKNTRLKYVGLPANQIISVVNKYKNVIACDKDASMYAFMQNQLDVFKPNGKVIVYLDDVLEFLEETNNKFSIFDLDLMCFLDDENFIRRIARAVARSSLKSSVVCIASCIGRKANFTEFSYRKLMPKVFLKELAKSNFIVSTQYSGGYTDKIIPMRYELFVLNKISDAVLCS